MRWAMSSRMLSMVAILVLGRRQVQATGHSTPAEVDRAMPGDDSPAQWRAGPDQALVEAGAGQRARRARNASTHILGQPRDGVSW